MRAANDNRPRRSSEYPGYYAACGRRLRRLREVMGVSEATFAVLLGLSVRSLRAYECGQRGSRGWTKIIQPIGELPTDVSLNWLFAFGYPTSALDERRPITPMGLPIRPNLRLAEVHSD